MNKGYVVVCDSRIAAEVIALAKLEHGQRWTQDIDKCKVFDTEEEAHKAASNLKYNNPRVWEWYRTCRYFLDV